LDLNVALARVGFQQTNKAYSKVEGDLCALLFNVRVEALLSIGRELVCQSRR